MLAMHDTSSRTTSSTLSSNGHDAHRVLDKVLDYVLDRDGFGGVPELVLDRAYCGEAAKLPYSFGGRGSGPSLRWRGR